MKCILNIASFALLITACSPVKQNVRDTKLLGFKYNYCAPNVPYLKQGALSKDTIDLKLTQTNISPRDQLICRILGVSKDIDGLWKLNRAGGKDNTADKVYLRQKISNKILLAQTQLQAVAAELDCEGERADMAATYLDALNSKRNTKLTVGSVILGALTTVATAVISNNGVQNTVGISGGLISAGLGAMTINPKGREVEFEHAHNLLRSIWTEPETNTDYPEFVWEMLHEKKFSNQGNVTLSESVKRRWIQFQFDGKIDPEQEVLLFGSGGFYGADDLHTRASMINQLQSSVRSLNQELTGLIGFVANME